MGSIKRQLTLGYSLLAISVVLVGSLFMIISKHSELNRELKQGAHSYVYLSAPQINQKYDVYFSSGYQKFHEFFTEVLKHNPDIDQIQIIRVDGTILFSSELLDSPSFVPSQVSSSMVSPDELSLIQSVEMAIIQGSNPLLIFFPVIDTWGSHRHTIRYSFHYNHVRNRILSLSLKALGVALLSIILILAVTQPLSRWIVSPIRELAFHADMVAQGASVKGLKVSRDDEIGNLINSFNSMANRIARQISELQSTNIELESAYEKLKSLDRMKTDLIATVSHELRTPLTTAKGYLEFFLYSDALSPEEKNKTIATALRNVNRLQGLIDGLIDLSLLKRDTFPVDIFPFAPADIIDSLKETYLNTSLPNNVRIEFHEDIPENLQVKGDRERIIQVMENLINNAIKFNTPRGFVDLFFEADKENVSFRIVDSGIGISGESLEKLGTKFFQVDATSRRKYGGLGLGLSIVKSILASHGTELKIESESGKGSTFSFSLPRITEGTLEERRDRLIIILESCQDLSNMIQVRLNDGGYPCTTVPNLETFRSTLLASKARLLLIDPLLDGELRDKEIEQILKETSRDTVPLFIISTLDREKISLDPDEYLKKPVSLARLTKTVRSLLKEEGDAT